MLSAAKIDRLDDLAMSARRIGLGFMLHASGRVREEFLERRRGIGEEFHHVSLPGRSGRLCDNAHADGEGLKVARRTVRRKDKHRQMRRGRDAKMWLQVGLVALLHTDGTTAEAERRGKNEC